MNINKAHHVPRLRHHKATGQGFVELNGRRIYLGRLGLETTQQKYHSVVAEWMANGRALAVDPTEITVAELVARFWRHAKQHYRRPDGSPTHEQNNFRQALRPLTQLYGSSRANDFGPRALKTVRATMIERGWCRSNVNKQIGRVKRVFRWAVENELVAPHVYHGVQAVPGLRYGRCEAHEAEPVRPVPSATVDGTLPQMTPTLRTMVQLQRLTGMRPGEVCIMRGCDLDTTGRVWVYQPSQHKTQHHGRDRMIYIGPKAQAVLRPFLLSATRAYLFSPGQSDRERRTAMNAARKTPLSCGNKPGSNRKENPRKLPGEQYTTASYGRAIAYACDRSFPPPKGLEGEALKQWRREHRWSPNRLRHCFATEVRREHGLEAAQVLLGHARADVSQVYAERDVARAIAVAAKTG